MRRKGANQHTSRARRNCAYCRTTFNWDDPQSEFYPTWDHKIPKSKGGGKGTNLVLACRRCNQEKGSMSVVEFREYLEVTRGCAGFVQRYLRWKKHTGTFEHDEERDVG